MELDVDVMVHATRRMEATVVVVVMKAVEVCAGTRSG